MKHLPLGFSLPLSEMTSDLSKFDLNKSGKGETALNPFLIEIILPDSFSPPGKTYMNPYLNLVSYGSKDR